MKGLFLLLLLTSCSSCPLSVFTEYVSVETLPSYRIKTPDPRLYCPDVGQKLHISWEIPPMCKATTAEIRLFLHFGNTESETYNFSIYERKGIYVFSLLGEEYWDKKGVLAYKVELYLDGELNYTWMHQLWAERIDLPT